MLIGGSCLFDDWNVVNIAGPEGKYYILKGGFVKPFINIKVLKGTLSKEKKDEMIKRVSETVAEIESRPAPKDNLLAYTWCVLEEVEFDHWGIGGNAVTPEILQAVIEGKT